MIYLVNVSNRLKVGYTSKDDIEKRLSSYRANSPFVQLISTRNGGLKAECVLHNLLKDYIVYGEWMRYDNKIIDIFNSVELPEDDTVKIDLATRMGDKNSGIRCCRSNTRFIKIPNGMTLSGLQPLDVYVYVCIRLYRDREQGYSFPSLETISRVSGLTVPTIIKRIDNLCDHGYLEVFKDGKKNKYKTWDFDSDNCEIISIKFLEEINLDPNLKAYIIASQQCMVKDINGYGLIFLSNYQLSNIINISDGSIRRYNRELKKLGYLVESDKIITERGEIDLLSTYGQKAKIFNLNSLGQDIIWNSKKPHEDRITDTEKRINELEKENKEQQKLIDALLRERDPKLRQDFII